MLVLEVSFIRWKRFQLQKKSFLTLGHYINRHFSGIEIFLRKAAADCGLEVQEVRALWFAWFFLYDHEMVSVVPSFLRLSGKVVFCFLLLYNNWLQTLQVNTNWSCSSDVSGVWSQFIEFSAWEVSCWVKVSAETAHRLSPRVPSSSPVVGRMQLLGLEFLAASEAALRSSQMFVFLSEADRKLCLFWKAHLIMSGPCRIISLWLTQSTD